MDKAHIIKKKRDKSIPWFEQIEKTVILPHETAKQVYYSIKPPDYVTVLAHTKEGKYIILNQYRPAVEDYTIELPSGHVEEGETPEAAMIRELREETGCDVESVTLLGELIPDTGRLENRLWAFYAEGITINEMPDPAENEGIEVRLVTVADLIGMIELGKMKHALDLGVITLAITKKHFKIT